MNEDPPPPDQSDLPPWRPTMPRTEAERWASRSVFRRPVFHATTPTAAEAIQRSGFDLSHRAFGRSLVDGIYATWDVSILSTYLTLHGEDAVALELKVDLGRVLTATVSERTRDHPIIQVVRHVPGGVAKFVLESLRSGPPQDALLEVLRREGYDAVEVVERGFSPRVDGSQLVVFDHQRIVVIADGD